MVKLSTQIKSIRTLNSKHLVVDWRGNQKLFYRMTRKQFAEGLKQGSAVVQQKLRRNPSDLVSFPLILGSTGTMSIGCEFFTRDDVRKIKRWAKEGK